jgi:hypothetical protein
MFIHLFSAHLIQGQLDARIKENYRFMKILEIPFYGSRVLLVTTSLMKLQFVSV